MYLLTVRTIKKSKHEWASPDHCKSFSKILKEEESDGEEKQVRFSGAQYHTVVPKNPELILDSGSSISLVKSKALLVDEVVVKCKNPIIMETNSRDKNVDEEGEVIDYGTSFFDESVLTNIFGLSDMVKKGHKVFINNDIGNTFIVTNKKSGRVSKFPCDVHGLYVRE